VEQLINEEEYDKAEKVADLAMEKMPVDIFGYYTLLEPYISAYYEVDKVEKGRDLFKKVSKKYQESLTYYSGLSIENQTRYLDEIVTDIERYRALVDILVIYKDGDFALEETERFNNYLKLFNHFAGDEPEDDVQPLMDDLDIISNDSVDSLFNME